MMNNIAESHIENKKKRSTQCFSSLNSGEGQQRWKSQAMPIECENPRRVGVANSTLFSPQLMHDQSNPDLQLRDQHLQRTMRQHASPSQVPPSNRPMQNPGMSHSPHGVPLNGPQTFGMTAESWMWDDEHLFLQPAPAQTRAPSSRMSSERHHKTNGNFRQEPSLNGLVGQMARNHQHPLPFNGMPGMTTGQDDGRPSIQERYTRMGSGHQQLLPSQLQGPVYLGGHQQSMSRFQGNERDQLFPRERAIARERQRQGMNGDHYQQVQPSLNSSYAAGEQQYHGTAQGNFGAPMGAQQPAQHSPHDTLQPIKWLPEQRLTTQLEAARQNEDHVSFAKMPQSSYKQQARQRFVNECTQRSSPKGFAPSVPGEQLQGSELSRFVAIMSLPSDRQQLTVYQILLRESLEYFAASQHDVDSPVRGRKQKIRLGQIGVRCRYCSHMRLNFRGKGAVYYPKSLINVYQAAQNIAGAHFCAEKYCCPFVPFSVVEEIEVQKPRRDASKAGRSYWVEACQKMGIYERDDGLWIQDCAAQVSNVNH